MKKAALAFFLCGLLIPAGFAENAETVFPPSEKSAGKIFLGEKIKFEVRYAGIPVGEAEATVKEIVKVNDRDAYHIEINVRSRAILDWIYKVRDTHHSYIDAERFHSLRYEKKIKEGRYWTDESMEYDQEGHVGCYWLRLQDLKPDSKVMIPVNADEKNWDLEVVTKGVREMKIDDVGIFQALEVEPIVLFEGFFVRRGKVRGWMSMDERRIPLLMKVKVPVLGEVVAELAAYEPGHAV
jgi:hypothetical protein